MRLLRINKDETNLNNKFKCKKCKGIYYIPVNLCPVCSNPADILTYIIEHWGEKIIGSPKFMGIVLDLMPNAEKQYINILRNIHKNKLDILLLRYVKERSAGDISSLKDTFKKDNGYSDVSDSVIDTLLYALGWFNQKECHNKCNNDNLESVIGNSNQFNNSLVLNSSSNINNGLFMICKKYVLNKLVILIVFLLTSGGIGFIILGNQSEEIINRQVSIEKEDLVGSFSGYFIYDKMEFVDNVQTYLKIENIIGSDSLKLTFRNKYITTCNALYDKDAKIIYNNDLGESSIEVSDNCIVIESLNPKEKNRKWKFRRYITQ